MVTRNPNVPRLARWRRVLTHISVVGQLCASRTTARGLQNGYESVRGVIDVAGLDWPSEDPAELARWA